MAREGSIAGPGQWTRRSVIIERNGHRERDGDKVQNWLPRASSVCICPNGVSAEPDGGIAHKV